MWTALNFEGILKTKKQARDICKGTLDIECERDWPVFFSNEARMVYDNGVWFVA